MKSIEKQESLDKYRTLIMATIDFLIENYSGSLVFDDYDFSKEYYVQERNQAEKYYANRRLDRLVPKLAALTKNLYYKIDLDYQHYIKEKTGYGIDLYNDLRLRIKQIIENEGICNEDEQMDMHFMIQLCKKNPAESFVSINYKLFLIDIMRRSLI